MRTVGSWGRPSVVRGLLLLTLLSTAPAVLPGSDSVSRQTNANNGNSLFALTVRNGRRVITESCGSGAGMRKAAYPSA